MATYRYRAFGGQGELAEGTLDAPNAGAMEALLVARGLTPFEIVEQAGGGARRRSGAKLGAAGLLSFTRDFAMLRGADVALDHALRLLSNQGSTAQRALAGGLLAEVLDGQSLSDALAKRGDVFSGEYVNAVKAGEASGHLGAALEMMAGLLEKRAEQAGKIRTALVYPAILVVMAMVSTGIVLLVLVPSVAPIFIDSGKPLPDGLKLIVAISDGAPYWGSGLALLVGAGVMAARRMRRDLGFKLSVDAAVLRLPVIGGLVAETDGARFARTLGSLVKAGVPLLQALSSAQASVGNLALRGGLADAGDRVRDGASLSRALAPVVGLPRVLIDMLEVGEEAGRPDEMLLRVAGMLERQTEHKVARAMALLTPVLTITIAAVVGGLMFAVMTAVLSINDLAVG